MTHRRHLVGVGFLLAAEVLSGCSRASNSPPEEHEKASAAGEAPAATADPSAVTAQPNITHRKIVRQGELELVVASPGRTQTAIERLAEQHGGYVVSAARNTENGLDVRVTVIVRVPQAELTPTIAELKHLGRGTGSERITSDDVTDEFVDLVARAASQRQLEQQYLEILKRAVTVKDAMDVQKELAEVRTEIERMQGRQQLLEKESAFSTLTVHLSSDAPSLAISPTTFGETIRRAWCDAVSLSSDIVSAGIHLAAFLVPVLLLVLLPSLLALWSALRISRAVALRRQRQRDSLLAAL